MRTGIKVKYLYYLLLLLPLVSNAQVKRSWNKPLYDAMPYHWGFAFNFGVLDFGINFSEHINSDTAKVISVEAGSGFNFGASIVGSLRLSECLDLRLLPGLTFGQRTLTYKTRKEGSSFTGLEQMQIPSTHLQLPLLLKYRAVRESNYRPYLIGGVNYAIDLSSRKETTKTEAVLLLNRQDLLLEIGFGVDYYLPFFKYTTEIRFSYGLLNIAQTQDVKPENQPYIDPLGKLNSKMLTFVMYFE